jgi:hypothetical protein
MLYEQLDATLVADAVRAVLTNEVVLGIDPAHFPQTSATLQAELALRLAGQEQLLEREFAERLAQATRDAAPNRGTPTTRPSRRTRPAIRRNLHGRP